MNFKVLAVLIETGYIQKILKSQNKSLYPLFLITMLKECDKNFIKEACCRMLIKYFGKDNEHNLVFSEGDAFDLNKFVEPIIQIVTRSNDYGSKVTSLSIMLLVNMCDFDQ